MGLRAWGTPSQAFYAGGNFCGLGFRGLGFTRHLGLGHAFKAACAVKPRLSFHPTVGALIIRIGFWGPLYYNYNQQNSIGNYLGPPYYKNPSICEPTL